MLLAILLRCSLAAVRRFTEKQYWIDEKIQLISSLPPVDALSPLPPQFSTTDRTQLSTWYHEFAAVEQEVEDYDMGDLASLRRFAASTSNFRFCSSLHHSFSRNPGIVPGCSLTLLLLALIKRDLSNEDTDLLEVTLTTLLSLDRLMSLLRQRHQQLDLLTHRIRYVDTALCRTSLIVMTKDGKNNSRSPGKSIARSSTVFPVSSNAAAIPAHS